MADISKMEMDKIPGLDMSIALSNVANNRVLLRNVLIKFHETHRDDVAVMRVSLQTNDINSARRIAHTLKGISATFGACDLHKTAVELDSAFIGLQSDRYEMLIDNIDRELNLLLGGIHRVLIDGMNSD